MKHIYDYRALPFADTTHTFPEPNVTTSADLGEKPLFVDVTNRLVLGIQTLVRIMGITRLIDMPRGSELHRYDRSVVDGGDQAEEAGYIPNSELKRLAQPDVVLVPKHRRATVSDRAIQAMGYQIAVRDGLRSLVRLVQKIIKKDFFSELITKSATDAGAGTDFQSSYAAVMGAIKAGCEDMGDIHPVIFANPLDAYGYLGKAGIVSQTAFGLDYVENFIGGRLFMTTEIPRGTLYGTVAENLNGAKIPRNADLYRDASAVFDRTGLVSLQKEFDTTTASWSYLLTWGLALYAENLEKVYKSVIGTSPASETEPQG